MREGFVSHLFEAIVLNLKRSNYYAAKTAQSSRLLSFSLISLEVMIIPMALYYDLRARRFNRRHIMIMQDDFESMKKVDDKEHPVRYRGTLQESDFKEVQRVLRSHLTLIREALGREDFFQTYVALVHTIEAIEACETRYRVHFAMTLHILESLAYFCNHSIKYALQSDGESVSFSKEHLRFQLLGLLSSLYMDRWAQKFHKQGVGILVNDLPKIDFRASAVTFSERHSPL